MCVILREPMQSKSKIIAVELSLEHIQHTYSQAAAHRPNVSPLHFCCSFVRCVLLFFFLSFSFSPIFFPIFFYTRNHCNDCYEKWNSKRRQTEKGKDKTNEEPYMEKECGNEGPTANTSFRYTVKKIPIGYECCCSSSLVS